MRENDDALDKTLGLLRTAPEVVWRNTGFDARGASSPQFGRHAAALCAAPEQPAGRSGAREAARLKRKVTEREAEWTRRTALDLQRLADLEEHMRVRHAETARRRWFVLGRLLTQAAAADPRWADIVALLATTRPLTRREERALGLTSRKI